MVSTIEHAWSLMDGGREEGKEGGREGEREREGGREEGRKRQVHWGRDVIHVQLVRPAIPEVIDKSQSIDVMS